MDFRIDAELERSKSVLMERLHVHFHKIIPELSLSRGQFEFATRLDQAVAGTVAQLRGWLLDGHKCDCEETQIIEFPATPWQFFKQKYAPKWWLRRWPVVLEERRVLTAIHHHHICPHVAVPDGSVEARAVHFIWMGEASGQLPQGSVARYEAAQREQELY